MTICCFSFNSLTFAVPDYSELVAELQAVKANVASESAKQAIQTVHDDVKDLLSWLKQRDGEKVPITVSQLANDLDALESQLNEDQSLKELVNDIASKIKWLRGQPFPLAQYAEALNNLIREFKVKLNGILGGGC